MRTRSWLAVLAAIPLLFVAWSSRAATLPSGFSETRVASGLANPTAMAIAPDGRIFIAQQSGALRVVRDGELLAQPFLTVSVNASGERGLLGVAFDPDFATNGYVYVYYTTASSPVHNRVSRFTASASNPDLAAAGSELPILDLPALGATNHNGGAIHFSRDGKLYVAVGDNAMRENAPSLNSPLGKLLRINKDGSIPTDNPFYSQTSGINRAIWSRGLRNPFTFAVDRTNGRIHVNDVGEGSWEEVNRATPGGLDFGWPRTEGPNPAGVSGVTYPVYAFQHPAGCSIAGGAFYRPLTFNFPSAYAGRYFFGDFCAGFIRMLSPPDFSTATGFATGIGSLVDIQVHQDGSLYYLAREGGELFRIRYTAVTPPSISSHPSGTTVQAGATARFSVTASGSAPLQYQRQRNGTNISGANASTYSFTARQVDNGAVYRVLITNAAGSVLSNSATLIVVPDEPVYSDDFEEARGWSLTPGRNTATTGHWQRGDPQPTTYDGYTIQPNLCGNDTANCLITGLAAGSVVNANDVDHGITSIQSPTIALPATGELRLAFRWFLAHLRNATPADFLSVRIVGADGVAQTVAAIGASSTNVQGLWRLRTVNLNAWRGQTVRIRVEAVDNDPNGVLEAGIDQMVITRQ